MSVGKNIKKLRIKAGLSQIELAKKIGITQSMLCQIERDTKNVNLYLGKEIATYLDCNLQDLVED